MPCKTATVEGPTDGGGGGGGGGGGDEGLPPQLQSIVDFVKENPMVAAGGLGAAGIVLMRPGGGDSGPMYMPRPKDYDRDGKRR